MRSQLFTNYGPAMLPLGAPLCKADGSKATQPGPWRAMPHRPGYECRDIPGGATEVRLTAELQGSNEARPAEPAKKDAPYCPEGWGGFQYHGADGKDGDIVRPAPATCTAPAQPAASAVEVKPGAGAVHHDDWQSGAPPVAGWYRTTLVGEFAFGSLHWRFHDGVRWSRDVVPYELSITKKLAAMSHRALADQDDIRYRGPRLTGPEWPEPEAKAEEVPSGDALRQAFFAAEARNCQAAWDLYSSQTWGLYTCPPAERAAAIAAFNAIPAA